MANVSSNNLTTLYSGGGVNVRPTSAYGNANVVSLLNVGTDGGNTITNIVGTGNITIENITANGNITADYFIGNFVGNVTGTANFANYAGNVTVSAQPNITSLGTLTGLSSNGTVNFANAGNINLGPESNIHISGGAANYALITDGAGNLSWGQVANAINANFANYAGNVTVSAQPNITSVGNLVDLRINNNQIHLGSGAGLASQGIFTIAIGPTAGGTNQGVGSLAVGINAGLLNQGGNSIAIGHNAAQAGQGIQSIAIGNGAGASFQGANSIAVGLNAGGGTQGANSIAIGTYAGQISSALETIAIGRYAGYDLQQQGAVAIGTGAGMQAQGQYSVAIGVNAGNSALGNNSIILNGTGLNLNQTTPNTFTVKPVRSANTANVMYYDSGTGEITYDLVSNLVGNVANFANFAGNVTVSAQPNITSLGTLSNLSVSGNANLANLSVSGNISSGNANLGNIAIANFFSGDGYLLSNLTIGAGSQILNGNTNVTALANSNVTFDVAGVSNVLVVTNTGATVNGTMIANFFSGDGSNLTNIGNSANANYAAYAGNVTINAQPNITSLGNLPYLQVSNSANADGTITQLGSNNITFATNFANTVSYRVTTLYGATATGNYPGERFIRSRGNATTPTTAVSGDRINQWGFYAFNGTVNPAAVVLTSSATGTVNPNANAAWTGGQFVISTGNPAGDTGNTGATSPTNVFTFSNSGALQITPGSVPNTSLGQITSSFLLNSYGRDTTNLQQVGGLNFQRARGNRDSQTNVLAGDQVGRSVFIAYSNGAYQSANVAQYRVTVDSSYANNDTIVPMSHTFQTVANVANVATFRSTTFNSNGVASFPGNINFSGSTANLFTGSSGQIALGVNAGTTSQGNNSVAIGRNAGTTSQGINGVAIGESAGFNAQGQYGVAIGILAGNTSQGNSSIAIGRNAGENSQGENSIAIGFTAGFTNQANNSIILNATGSILDQTTANTFTVKPVRTANTANVMFYNSSSGEISYDAIANYSGNIGAGNITITGTANIANLQLNQYQEDVYAIGTTSGTITPDFNNGSIQSMTLNGAVTINSLGNAVAGRSMTLIITQDGTGGRILSSSMLFSDGYKILSTAAGAVDIISVFYNGTSYYAVLSKGYS